MLQFASRSVGLRVVLVFVTTIGLLAGAAGTSLAGYRAHQPDLLAGNFSTARCCLGVGIYEGWPNEQVLDDVTVEQGGETVLMVPLYNDGTSNDSFRLTGERSY